MGRQPAHAPEQPRHPEIHQEQQQHDRVVAEGHADAAAPAALSRPALGPRDGPAARLHHVEVQEQVDGGVAAEAVQQLRRPPAHDADEQRALLQQSDDRHQQQQDLYQG